MEMKDLGWIQKAREDGDDRRRTYEITSRGRSLLAAELARLEALLEQARPAMADGDAG
jgi:DNA-binding PadR family transcriptional regulator